MTAHPFLDRVRGAELTRQVGQVRRILPTFIEADGPNGPLRSLCRVETIAPGGAGPGSSLAEIVSVGPDSVILAPLENGPTTFAGALVTACGERAEPPVGDALLGRALNAMGEPIDGLPPVRSTETRRPDDATADILARSSDAGLIETGVRAIDGLLPLGHGQRIGLFAASGVGKTTLLGQLARQARVDRCVICLIGERGHEVEGLWTRDLSAEAKSRSFLVAATADQPAGVRLRAAEYALAVASHWRDQGKRVLLLLDSATRLAMALREIGLAAGEPPTVRAYTPSVFTTIPRLVEQCGALRSGGSITAVLTVLTETDDGDDPLAEMMKSLLDGHLVLSRSLAEQGSFPAIDLPRSISRWAGRLVEPKHRAAIVQAVGAISLYEQSRALIESGLYAAGGDAAIDRAIRLKEGLSSFLQQAENEHSPFARTRAVLDAALGQGA